MPLPQQLTVVETRVPVIGRDCGGRQHGTFGMKQPEESVSVPDRLLPSRANVPPHVRLQSPASPPVTMLVLNTSVKAPVALSTVPVAAVPAPGTQTVSVVRECTKLTEDRPDADAPTIDQLP